MTEGATLSFYGGAGTVTGSKYLVRAKGRQVLMDAGLFQGLKELRLRNWRKPPFDPAQLNAVVLSHAHIDHSGYLPLLVRNRFRGPVYCTPGTEDLLGIMLPDSAHLQEEEASFANRRGYSKHTPALPLYAMEDALESLKLVESKPYGKLFAVNETVKVMFHRAGHILGAAIVEMQLFIRGKDQPPFRVVFSGDLGRCGQPIIRDPETIPEADVLLVESTYGDRTHTSDAPNRFADIVRETAARKGALIIPAFAVGRTQELLWHLHHLEAEKKIPALPIFVDSPMAISTIAIYSNHPEEHDVRMSRLIEENRNPLVNGRFQLLNTPEESKKLNEKEGPFILISASGMATGGRVLHHLALRLPDPNTTVLLVGYQAAGTRGRTLQDGAKKIKMFGQEIAVNAKVEVLQGLSAHADRDDIMKWLRAFKKPPKQTYVVHGEDHAAEAMAESIKSKLRWNVTVAEDGKTVPLK